MILHELIKIAVVFFHVLVGVLGFGAIVVAVFGILPLGFWVAWQNSDISKAWREFVLFIVLFVVGILLLLLGIMGPYHFWQFIVTKHHLRLIVT